MHLLGEIAPIALDSEIGCINCGKPATHQQVTSVQASNPSWPDCQGCIVMANLLCDSCARAAMLDDF